MKIILQEVCELPEYLSLLIKDLPLDQAEGLSQQIPSIYTHILRYDENGLSLLENGIKTTQVPPAPTKVDFVDGTLQHRKQTSGKSQGIAKAVGLNKLGSPTVVDATAGLGKDSYILATLGAQMTLLERSPLIHALLQDGFRRGLDSSDPELRTTLASMTLYNTDAHCYFEQIEAGKVVKPDIVYLDPMFPPRSKSAKVKKDIVMLQQVLGFDEDFDALLVQACRCAEHRVVVKRPGKKGKKSSIGADFQIEGKSAYFDVYL